MSEYNYICIQKVLKNMYSVILLVLWGVEKKSLGGGDNAKVKGYIKCGHDKKYYVGYSIY